MNHKPTEEQQAILAAFSSGERLVVDAAAGSGKTSTLRMLAENASGRCAYLAYNRAIKDDASRSFPGSVSCMTSHGMAYGPVATRYKHRLRGGRVPALQVAQILGIREPIRLAADLAPLAPQQLARIATATVGRFCHGADDEVTDRHVPVVNGLELPALRAALAAAVLPYARKAWADIIDPAGRLRFEHDHYLKIYQLARPTLPYDVLFVDEAQDLNPVVQAIVGYQRDAQVILVGDRCQQLYAWRGAVDAMSTFDGRRLQLTQSFRFGDAVADEANKWLSILRADIRVRGLASIPSRVGHLDEPAAILCRSNGAALSRVLDAHDNGRRAALVGRVGKDIASLARAARDLMVGRSCDHPELMAFSSWHEVRDYVAQDESAADLRVFVDLIDKHSPDGVLSIVDRLVSEDRADVVVSTAHREGSRVAVCRGGHRLPSAHARAGRFAGQGGARRRDAGLRHGHPGEARPGPRGPVLGGRLCEPGAAAARALGGVQPRHAQGSGPARVGRGGRRADGRTRGAGRMGPGRLVRGVRR